MASSTATRPGRAEPRARLTRRAWLLGASAGLGALVGRQCLSPTNHPGPVFPDADAAGARAVSSTTPVSSLRRRSPRTSRSATIRGPGRSSAFAPRSPRRARRSRPFIASAARHSMGGQSLARDGTVATLDQQWLEADTARKIYRVGGRHALVDRHRAGSTRSASRRPSCSRTTTSAWPARSRSTRTAGRCPSAAAAARSGR